MVLHIIKLCVGAESVEDLADWQAAGHADWKGPGGMRAVAHLTRHSPKRAQEILEGGSLYWVIRGRIQARQKLLAIESNKSKDGLKRCALVMDPAIVATRPQPHRAFQGWRYFDASRAPADIGVFVAEKGIGAESLKAELVELGLI